MPNEPIDFNQASYNEADHKAFLQAISYGIPAAIFGCLIYAAFTIATNIQIGYLAVGVGWVIGWAMKQGSGSMGGRKYQIAAVILTYLAVALAWIPETLWALHKEGYTGGISWPRTIGYGLISPFTDVAENPGSGLLGLFILFIGIRFAWQFTRGHQ